MLKTKVLKTKVVRRNAWEEKYEKNVLRKIAYFILIFRKSNCPYINNITLMIAFYYYLKATNLYFCYKQIIILKIALKSLKLYTYIIFLFVILFISEHFRIFFLNFIFIFLQKILVFFLLFLNFLTKNFIIVLFAICNCLL